MRLVAYVDHNDSPPPIGARVVPIEADPSEAIGKGHLAVDHLILGATEFPEAELIAQRARAAVRTDLSSRVPGIRMETAEAPGERPPEPAAEPEKPQPEEKPENEEPKVAQALASAGKKGGSKMRKSMSKKTTKVRK